MIPTIIVLQAIWILIFLNLLYCTFSWFIITIHNLRKINRSRIAKNKQIFIIKIRFWSIELEIKSLICGYWYLNCCFLLVMPYWISYHLSTPSIRQSVSQLKLFGKVIFTSSTEISSFSTTLWDCVGFRKTGPNSYDFLYLYNLNYINVLSISHFTLNDSLSNLTLGF